MKKNILFIYRGQVLLKEFLPEYEKYSGENCVLLVEKGIPYNIVLMDIKKLGLNVNLLTHDDLLENKIKMIFDSIVMNPPYKDGLHIEIFNKAFDLLKEGGEMMCIHPSTPFLNRKPNSKKNKNNRIIEIISEYESEIKLVDGNKLFNAGFFTPLSITKVKKVKNPLINVVYSHIDENNNEVKTYTSIDKIFLHGFDGVVNIKDKIFSKMTKSVEEYNMRKKNNMTFPYYIKTTSILGNIPKKGKLNPDFYCIIYKSDEQNFDGLLSQEYNTGVNYIGFNSISEARNGFEYFKTKFARFCVSLYKLNQNLHRGELSALPYLDFNTEWNDEMLFEYFNLSDDEINFIKIYIANWYEKDFV